MQQSSKLTSDSCASTAPGLVGLSKVRGKLVVFAAAPNEPFVPFEYSLEPRNDVNDERELPVKRYIAESIEIGKR